MKKPLLSALPLSLLALCALTQPAQATWRYIPQAGKYNGNDDKEYTGAITDSSNWTIYVLRLGDGTWQIGAGTFGVTDKCILPARIRHRVLAGGHAVPDADVLRRFGRSRANLREYAARADRLLVFDARLPVPELIYRKNGEERAFDATRARFAKEDLGL